MESASLHAEGRPFVTLPREPSEAFVGRHDLKGMLARSNADGFTWWTRAVGNALPRSLLTFARQNRKSLGFGLGEEPILVDGRVYKRFANGAVSLGAIVAIPAQPERGCFVDTHEAGFFSTLPGPGERLGEPPDLDGSEALARVHDMNPYVTFEPLDDEDKSRVFARLVVVSTRTLASRLAWEVRYSFACTDAGSGGESKMLREKAYAYVDARSGVLVIGRDPARSGGSPMGEKR